MVVDQKRTSRSIHTGRASSACHDSAHYRHEADFRGLIRVEGRRPNNCCRRNISGSHPGLEVSAGSVTERVPRRRQHWK